MIQVNIATLKAQLSAFLARVKNGEQVLILDRKHPIAKITLYDERSDFRITESKRSPAELKRIKFKPLRVQTDVVRLLREERDRR